MAESKTTNKDVEKALASLGPLASIVGKSAATLWKIFVMKYVAEGLAELGAGILISAGSIWLLGDKNHWLLIPFAMSTLCAYYAIQHLVNPWYPAMDDVIVHVKDLGQKKTAELVVAEPRRSY
jgi:hypothetical protein